MATITEKSRTKEIIHRLQSIIDTAPTVPLAPGKVSVFKDEVQSLLNELATQMDIELKTYHEVNDRRGKIISEAKKEAEQMRSSVKNGDKITTIGGIVGTVVNVKEDKLVIETGADQVRIEIAKWAMSTNETAAENAKAEAKKVQEAKAKAKAAKKAEKEGK